MFLVPGALGHAGPHHGHRRGTVRQGVAAGRGPGSGGRSPAPPPVPERHPRRRSQDRRPRRPGGGPAARASCPAGPVGPGGPGTPVRASASAPGAATPESVRRSTRSRTRAREQGTSGLPDLHDPGPLPVRTPRAGGAGRGQRRRGRAVQGARTTIVGWSPTTCGGCSVPTPTIPTTRPSSTVGHVGRFGPTLGTGSKGPGSVVRRRSRWSSGRSSEGLEHLVEGMAAGKGVIMALPHVGSWEYRGGVSGHAGPADDVGGRTDRAARAVRVLRRAAGGHGPDHRAAGRVVGEHDHVHAPAGRPGRSAERPRPGRQRHRGRVLRRDHHHAGRARPPWPSAPAPNWSPAPSTAAPAPITAPSSSRRSTPPGTGPCGRTWPG